MVSFFFNIFKSIDLVVFRNGCNVRSYDFFLKIRVLVFVRHSLPKDETLLLFSGTSSLYDP